MSQPPGPDGLRAVRTFATRGNGDMLAAVYAAGLLAAGTSAEHLRCAAARNAVLDFVLLLQGEPGTV